MAPTSRISSARIASRSIHPSHERVPTAWCSVLKSPPKPACRDSQDPTTARDCSSSLRQRQNEVGSCRYLGHDSYGPCYFSLPSAPPRRHAGFQPGGLLPSRVLGSLVAARPVRLPRGCPQIYTPPCTIYVLPCDPSIPPRESQHVCSRYVVLRGLPDSQGFGIDEFFSECGAAVARANEIAVKEGVPAKVECVD